MERIHAVSDSTLLGAGGEFSDFQQIQHILGDLTGTDRVLLILPTVHPTPLTPKNQLLKEPRRRFHALAVGDLPLPPRHHVSAAQQDEPLVEQLTRGRVQGRRELPRQRRPHRHCLRG